MSTEHFDNYFETRSVPVTERIAKYHPAMKAFLANKEWQHLTSEHVPRAGRAVAGPIMTAYRQTTSASSFLAYCRSSLLFFDPGAFQLGNTAKPTRYSSGRPPGARANRSLSGVILYGRPPFRPGRARRPSGEGAFGGQFASELGEDREKSRRRTCRKRCWRRWRHLAR